MNSESGDEEGAGSLGESLADPDMSLQATEAAANHLEAGTSQMELRHPIP